MILLFLLPSRSISQDSSAIKKWHAGASLNIVTLYSDIDSSFALTNYNIGLTPTTPIDLPLKIIATLTNIHEPQNRFFLRGVSIDVDFAREKARLNRIRELDKKRAEAEAFGKTAGLKLKEARRGTLEKLDSIEKPDLNQDKLKNKVNEIIQMGSSLCIEEICNDSLIDTNAVSIKQDAVEALDHTDLPKDSISGDIRDKKQHINSLIQTGSDVLIDTTIANGINKDKLAGKGISSADDKRERWFESGFLKNIEGIKLGTVNIKGEEQFYNRIRIIGIGANYVDKNRIYMETAAGDGTPILPNSILQFQVPEFKLRFNTLFTRFGFGNIKDETRIHLSFLSEKINKIQEVNRPVRRTNTGLTGSYAWNRKMQTIKYELIHYDSLSIGKTEIIPASAFNINYNLNSKKGNNLNINVFNAGPAFNLIADPLFLNDILRVSGTAIYSIGKFTLLPAYNYFEVNQANGIMRSNSLNVASVFQPAVSFKLISSILIQQTALGTNNFRNYQYTCGYLVTRRRSRAVYSQQLSVSWFKNVQDYEIRRVISNKYNFTFVEAVSLKNGFRIEMSENAQIFNQENNWFITSSSTGIRFSLTRKKIQTVVDMNLFAMNNFYSFNTGIGLGLVYKIGKQSEVGINCNSFNSIPLTNSDNDWFGRNRVQFNYFVNIN